MYDIYRFFPGLRRLHLNIRVVRTEHADLQEVEVPNRPEIVDGQHDIALVDHTLARLSDQRAHSRDGEAAQRFQPVAQTLYIKVGLYIDGVVGGQRKLLLQTMARYLAGEESFIP